MWGVVEGRKTLCIWMKFVATANDKFGIGYKVLYLFILI